MSKIEPQHIAESARILSYHVLGWRSGQNRCQRSCSQPVALYGRGDRSSVTLHRTWAATVRQEGLKDPQSMYDTQREMPTLKVV
jgi:hypothetical protein